MGGDRLVLLPGLGADAELLEPQRRESTPATRLRHIHGSSDRLLPIRVVQPTAVVPGGGHFINVTHAEQVNVCVRRAIEDA